MIFPKIASPMRHETKVLISPAGSSLGVDHERVGVNPTISIGAEEVQQHPLALVEMLVAPGEWTKRSPADCREERVRSAHFLCKGLNPFIFSRGNFFLPLRVLMECHGGKKYPAADGHDRAQQVDEFHSRDLGGQLFAVIVDPPGNEAERRVLRCLDFSLAELRDESRELSLQHRPPYKFAPHAWTDAASILHHTH